MNTDSIVLPTFKFINGKGLRVHVCLYMPFLMSQTLQYVLKSRQEAKIVQIDFSESYVIVEIREFSNCTLYSVGMEDLCCLYY